MKNILDNIIEKKKERVQEYKKKYSINDILKSLKNVLLSCYLT